MDEWKPVKSAVKWGLAALAIFWILNMHPTAIDFGVFGTIGFVNAMTVKKEDAAR